MTLSRTGLLRQCVGEPPTVLARSTLSLCWSHRVRFWTQGLLTRATSRVVFQLCDKCHRVNHLWACPSAVDRPFGIQYRRVQGKRVRSNGRGERVRHLYACANELRIQIWEAVGHTRCPSARANDRTVQVNRHFARYRTKSLLPSAWGASCQYHRSAEFIPQSACISPQLRNEFRPPFPS